MVIKGFLTLHRATLEGEWLRKAIKLGETMVEKFWDKESNVLYDTTGEQKDLFVRPRNLFDEALPSGSSAATSVLLTLARITDKHLFQQVAMQSLRSAAETMRQYPLGMSNWLCALDFYLSQPKEIVIVGQKGNNAIQELLRTVSAAWLPNTVVVGHDPAEPSPLSGLPLFGGKHMIDNQPTVYVCEGYTCQNPVTDAASLKAQLSSYS